VELDAGIPEQVELTGIPERGNSGTSGTSSADKVPYMEHI
jgi:hypothetical protein